MPNKPSGPEHAAELEALRARLAVAEDALHAIRNGNVDAVLVTGKHGEQAYTLIGADRIYRQLIETMSEGAATLSADGVILYGNVRLAAMLGQPLDQVMGTVLRNHMPPADQRVFDAILAQSRTAPIRREINLKTSDGRLMPVYLSASRLPSEGAGVVTCLVLTDLTEQKSHEQIAAAAERIRKLNRVYAMLSNINQAIVRIREPQALFDEVCRVVVEDGGFRMAWIGLVDPASRSVLRAAHAGVMDRYLEILDIVPGAGARDRGPTGNAVRTGTYRVCNDIENDPCMMPWREDAMRNGYRSSATFPLKVSDGNVRGIFGLYAVEVGFFDDDEIKLLDELATDIGFAMEYAERESERKRAEQALITSEERFRTAAENLMDVVYDWDIHEKVDWYGDIDGMMGYPPGGFPRTITGWMATIHPEDKDRIITALEGHLKGRAPYIVEYRVKRRDGEWRWWSARGAALRDNRGEPYKMIGSVTDITKHKKTEEAIQESEARYRALFELSADGILIVDNETKRFKYMNPAICRMLGYTPDELKTLGVSNIHPKDDLPYVMAEFEAQTRGVQTVAVNIPCLRKDGTIFYADVNAALATMDGHQCLFGFFRDITERKRAQEALLASEQEFRSLAESMPQIVWVTRPDGSNIYFNQQWVDYTGMTLEQSYGDGWITPFHPDDKQRAWDAWQRATQHNDIYSVECRLRRADGAYRWWLVRGVPRRNASGEILKWFGTCTDIEDIKRAEAESAKTEGLLRQAQKMEAVGRLAGGVAHDFNNLLTGIMGYAELCQDGIEPGHPIREWLDEILREAHRSADIVRQLLTFARKQIIAPKVLDLNDAVAGMITLLRRLIGEDINLAWLPGADLRPVRLDPSQVDQILANLCVNARDAIASTGKVTIETANVTIDQAYCSGNADAIPGTYVSLAVSDDGSGMDHETLAQIFEPFFTTKGLGKGTGLGLATVYGIVRQNNGFISVSSTLGKGTTFTIYLPEVASEAGATSVTPTVAPRGRGEMILLVEDEKSLRVTCGLFLESFGYKVLLAETPGEALKMAARHPGDIHLLLTDVVMPGMDGQQLAKRIRADKPGVRVLFMSGYTSDVIIHRGVVDEGVNFLSKPFMRDDLARKVREVLDKQ